MHDFDAVENSCALGDHSGTGSENRADEDRRKCRDLEEQHYDNENDRDQRNNADVEVISKTAHVFDNCSRIIVCNGIAGTCDTKDHETDQPARKSGIAHGTDMPEKCAACHRRCKVCSIRERGHLITEKSTGDNCTGNQSRRKSHGKTNSHAGKSCGCCGTIGSSCEYRQDRAED